MTTDAPSTTPAAVPVPGAPPADGPRRSWRRFVPIGLLLAILLANLAGMPGGFWGGDSICWQEEARSMVLRGSWSIPESVATRMGEPGQFFVQNPDDGLWYSKYGIVNGLMSLPPTLIERWVHGPQQEPGQAHDLLIFNLYQIFLCLVVAALLYAITGAFTASWIARVAYVLAAFYATYLWYYQRAIGSEIYQVLFYAAFCLCFLRFARGVRASGGRVAPGPWVALLGAWCCVAALVLTRVLFGLLIPITAAVALLAVATSAPARKLAAMARALPYLLIPGTVIVLALGAVDEAKFGSPWVTGYHQWNPDWTTPNKPLWNGVRGFLLDPRFSILTYFPLIVLSWPMLVVFVRRHLIESVLFAATAVAFVAVVAKTTNWPGEYTYGPRYVLFFLPILALPAVLLFERLAQRPRSVATWILALAALIPLGLSWHVNRQANRLGFFAYYMAKLAGDVQGVPAFDEYFRSHHQGSVCADLIRLRESGTELEFFPELRQARGDAFVRQYAQTMCRLVDVGNSYWTTQDPAGR